MKQYLAIQNAKTKYSLAYIFQIKKRNVINNKKLNKNFQDIT